MRIVIHSYRLLAAIPTLRKYYSHAISPSPRRLQRPTLPEPWLHIEDKGACVGFLSVARECVRLYEVYIHTFMLPKQSHSALPNGYSVLFSTLLDVLFAAI